MDGGEGVGLLLTSPLHLGVMGCVGDPCACNCGLAMSHSQQVYWLCPLRNWLSPSQAGSAMVLMKRVASC